MGFEPTTSAVTGRRSNQLSHQAKYFKNFMKALLLQNCTLNISSHFTFVKLFYILFPSGFLSLLLSA